jgi:hypothetical protein
MSNQPVAAIKSLRDSIRCRAKAEIRLSMRSVLYFRHLVILRLPVESSPNPLLPFQSVTMMAV